MKRRDLMARGAGVVALIYSRPLRGDATNRLLLSQRRSQLQTFRSRNRGVLAARDTHAAASYRLFSGTDSKRGSSVPESDSALAGYQGLNGNIYIHPGNRFC
jgi:hypothetical protein